MSTEDFKAQAAQADRIAASLVVQKLGGSISGIVYETVVETVSHAWLLGYAQGCSDESEGRAA